LETALANVTLANILTAEAGLFVGIVALAMWVMKITVSTYWLTVIGEIARAIAGAVIHVTTQIGLLLLAVPVGVFCGVATIKRGEAGRGWTMILIALTLPALSVAVFADPAGEMYGPNGLLAFARRTGFSVAEAATNNGSLTGPGGTGVDALTANLITHTVREPLQLWNFGHVVDHVGGCGPAWSAAVAWGEPAAPIKAMGACGDRAAVAYAQHLDGTNMWTGLIFVAAAGLLGLFMVASGWAVLKVSVKAVWITVILLPSLWLGAIPGAPQRRAVDVMWQFFRHGVEVMVYIVFVSAIGLAVQRIVSNPLPAQLGGTNPFAHVLMMGAVSIAAYLLLRHIRADMSGHPRGPGLVRRGADVALGLGMHAAAGAAGSAALSGAKGLRHRLGGGRTPWDQVDQAAENAPKVHGGPQAGVDPVPNAPGDDGAAGAAPNVGGATPSAPGGAASEPDNSLGSTVGAAAPAGPAASGGDQAAQLTGAPASSGVGPILDELNSVRGQAQPARRAAERTAPPPAQGTLFDPSAAPATSGHDQPSRVAPIADWAATPGAPLPPEPAPDDAPPPPENGGPATAQPTSVDPVDDENR
jgi:hypothetical protein